MDPQPVVRLLAAFPHPLDTAVAAARTCTSASGTVRPDAVLGAPDLAEGEQVGARSRRDALAKSLYAAGHHTTFQHAHFLFSIERVSRQFVWSFLHAHPYSNSEQVSQRYVRVATDEVLIPELPPAASEAARMTVGAQHAAYERLVLLLGPIAESEVLKRFPTWRRHPKRLARQSRRKAQEVARSVLPVATYTALLHTVSCLTLFRYRRLCLQFDVPGETRRVVDAMIAAALAHDADLAAVFEEPIPLESTPEYDLFTMFHGGGPQPAAYRSEFDRNLAGLTSRLLSPGGGNVAAVAAAVRAVLGVPVGRLADEEAVRLALDPGVNRLLGEDLNLSTLSKLGRCLHHAHYTFAKKLSHAADSQDQRHRMTPAARPLLAAVVDDQPDVVMPRLVAHAGGEARKVFDEAVVRAWEGAGKVRRLGGSEEAAEYLLPNALAIRFLESSDLLNLHHKHRMRLCYNAQEEIWQACLDEALQIREAEPAIGRWLLPPCAVRQLAGRKPFCPEGERFCGIAVWRIQPAEYRRII
ncbi:MAG: FAD-dependent thymidylate synthase [Acidobacteriia bacterium]|nr:FAD-dependent thymidylate synthase [Terriglobia bacterium]